MLFILNISLSFRLSLCATLVSAPGTRYDEHASFLMTWRTRELAQLCICSSTSSQSTQAGCPRNGIASEGNND